jgi:hypothetical protein
VTAAEISRARPPSRTSFLRESSGLEISKSESRWYALPRVRDQKSRGAERPSVSLSSNLSAHWGMSSSTMHIGPAEKRRTLSCQRNPSLERGSLRVKLPFGRAEVSTQDPGCTPSSRKVSTPPIGVGTVDQRSEGSLRFVGLRFVCGRYALPRAKGPKTEGGRETFGLSLFSL